MRGLVRYATYNFKLADLFGYVCCRFTLLLAYTGMSSAASSALFYAARVGDVPAVFMAEPDDITVLSGKTYTILKLSIPSCPIVPLPSVHSDWFNCINVVQPHRHESSSDLNNLILTAEFIDTSAGGEIAHRLARAPEVEIIMPLTGDHATVNREVSLTWTTSQPIKNVL